MNVLVLAVVAVAVAGSSPGSWTAHPDGRIGPFRIDVTTEAQIRAELGRPLGVEPVYWPTQKAVYGRRLTYRCGPKCRTDYSINSRTGKLSDFWSQSHRFVTERGTRPGMTAREAKARERKTLLPGCGSARYIHLRWDQRHGFVLVISHRRVESIGYLGPHTISYEGLC